MSVDAILILEDLEASLKKADDCFKQNVMCLLSLCLFVSQRLSLPWHKEEVHEKFS
jgi:hypothetical protein